MDPERLQDCAVRAADGDRDALETLLAHHLPEVRAFVRLRSDRALRSRESSSDLVQSACREVLEKADHFQYADGEGFRRWLFTTVQRKIHDRRAYHLADQRDVMREVNAPNSAVDRELLECYGSVCTPSRAASAREELEQVERAMDTLSEEHRAVITLSRVAGLSHAAIAAEMGKSEGAVRMLLHRALAALVLAVERERKRKRG